MKSNFIISLITSAIYLFIKAANSILDLPALLQNQGSDLLCLPWLLSTSTLVIMILRRDWQFRLSRLQVFVGFVYLSGLFEIVLPYFSPIYTSDYKDVVAYFFGGLIYHIFDSIRFYRMDSLNNN